MDFADFFDVQLGPARDRWDRPLLIPRGGSESDRKPYTRASSLANMIEDHTGVHKWEMRYLAVGLSRRMDLVRLAAGEVYTTGFDKPDDKTNKQSGGRLDEIIERALDTAKIHEKADYGTAVHARTEPGNEGVDPDEMQARDVQSFWDLTRENGLVHIGTELFTANDELGSSGTFDHLTYVPGFGICVTDKKTSKTPKMSYDVQLTSYAGGPDKASDIYDVETDQRSTLEIFVESQGWDPALVRRDIGFLFWIKNGKTTMHKLDLNVGWEAAKIAAWVRDNHRKKGVAKNTTSDVSSAVAAQRERLTQEIASAPTTERLNQLWNNRQLQAVWTDDHTLAAKARMEAL